METTKEVYPLWTITNTFVYPVGMEIFYKYIVKKTNPTTNEVEILWEELPNNAPNRHIVITSSGNFDIYDEKSKYISNIDISFPGEIEKVISNAISKSDKIEIIYNDMDGGKSKRIIHPLQLFKYKDDYYVTAYCELRNDIRHFELKRIISIK